jgi:hypothetical protein
MLKKNKTYKPDLPEARMILLRALMEFVLTLGLLVWLALLAIDNFNPLFNQRIPVTLALLIVAFLLMLIFLPRDFLRAKRAVPIYLMVRTTGKLYSEDTSG